MAFWVKVALKVALPCQNSISPIMTKPLDMLKFLEYVTNKVNFFVCSKDYYYSGTN